MMICQQAPVTAVVSSSESIGMEERPTPAAELPPKQARCSSLRRSKLLLIGIAVVAAVIVAFVIYKLASTQQQDAYEANASQLAARIVDTFEADLTRVVDALKSMSIAITSYASDSNSTFPYVTVSNFEARGISALSITKALTLAFAPYVLEGEVDNFTAYAVAQQGWVTKSLNFVDKYPTASRKLQRNKLNPAGDSYPSYVDRIRNDDNSTTSLSEPSLPIWQIARVSQKPLGLLFNQISNPKMAGAINVAKDNGRAAFTEIFLPKRELVPSTANIVPSSFVFYPVFSGISNRSFAGTVSMLIDWQLFLGNYMQPGEQSMVVVLENSCQQTFTYKLKYNEAKLVGPGDLHDPQFDAIAQTSGLLPAVETNGNNTACQFQLQAYPSNDSSNSNENNQPLLYAILVIALSTFLLSLFLLYDYFQVRTSKREASTLGSSESDASPGYIEDTTSMDPPGVVDSAAMVNLEADIARLPSEKEQNDAASDVPDPLPPPVDETTVSLQHLTPKFRIKEYLAAESSAPGEVKNDLFVAKPIADLFPKTTVMFADIAGFTAWSSEREPAQVFLLLETVYHAFDQIAKRRGVFKVETIRDCYVAVAGLPDPQDNHAVVMAQFACDCMKRMKQLTRRLEVLLGPDTGDLTMRFGLHSGPVTAGVLRGEKSRFQLFGDTVNTASRLEATGERDRIQISQETADLLIAAGMGHWIRGRRELVRSVGKGDMKTFWLDPQQDKDDKELEDVEEPANRPLNRRVTLDMKAEKLKAMGKLPPPAAIPEAPQDSDPWGDATLDKSFNNMLSQYDKLQRLVDWNVDVLCGHLKSIVAQRMAAGNQLQCVKVLEHNLRKDMTVLDEVTEIITLPSFDPKAVASRVDPDTVELDQEVVTQLHDYVSVIASMYRPNPFHNFEHASHVTMSVNKLLTRIVTPDLDGNRPRNSASVLASDLHDYTFGITSDPLTQFAVVFSALIHDVDHPGVSNFQLIKEEAFIATLYRNKSVAEQNSVDMAWDLLMDESYDALRQCIYSTEAELSRFRQLVVNVVMATDIFDQELKALRNNRWDRAFHDASALAKRGPDFVNRKATIVIEHIIQASDVAHTMQHWHVYMKWNERLFEEMYVNYCSGRSDRNPAEGWYFGEISFFDNYIIPLAKKLKECGVFGVSSDEYLNYAVKNRQEWAAKGEDIVREFAHKFESKEMAHPTKH